jgi:two-component system cell cycle response regulator
VAIRRLVGTIAGVAGLIVAMIAYVLDLSALAPVAGVLALLAGGMVLGAEQRRMVAEVRAADMREELEDRRVEIVRLREEITDLHRQHETTQETLAEMVAHQPAAGSFDRKFENTAPRVGRASQTDTKLLADPETNLFSEAYFRVALDARIASARRHLRPVAIALVEVNEGVGNGDVHPADPVKVTGSIRSTLRDADTACRMIDGCFALILEDTPENGAVWTVERIRRNLISRHGHHTLWAGVACYPAHAFSTDELLDQANLALESAREWKQDRIEVATAD